ncbi:TLD domain-containing protein, putative [Eimeria acervulina]|uniref:TLD domain-containing protein, putative n=1 Tax=Eimeria acervulina TaxID=5801 RepID=U6GKW2_EIMAC|nr:TLD domain-containing protein, putative [Eimeria acervulina]CDI79923.1 TLD domain-containing protein, putative [Eimeria acervulina]
MQQGVGSTPPSQAPGDRSTPSAPGQGLQPPLPPEGALSVSDRVAAAATAAAAAAAATAAARAEATAATARRYLQPWVLVDKYSKWRHLDQEELKAWQAKGESIFREHLLPYVPSDVSPAVAAVEADVAIAAAPSAAACAAATPGSAPAAATATGSGGTPASGRSAVSASAAAAAAAAAAGTNRFTALFGGSAAPHLSAAALSHHPWTAEQVRDVLRFEIWAGVPDAFKCCVLIHSNDALQQQRLHPTLYRQVQLESFGPPPFPGSVPGRCPTFSGGLLGLEEDVCGVQTTLNQLELDGDAPLATWRSAPDDCGTATATSTSRPARVRLPHPYLPGIMSPGGKSHARSPGKNPLGQRLKPEFNFWPDTSRRAEESEEKIQQQLQQQENKAGRNSNQEQQRNHRRHRHSQPPHHHLQQQVDSEGQGSCKREESIEALLAYIGPNSKLSPEVTPSTASTAKAKAAPRVGPVMRAARRWQRRGSKSQASEKGPPSKSQQQLPVGESAGREGGGERRSGLPGEVEGGGGAAAEAERAVQQSAADAADAAGATEGSAGAAGGGALLGGGAGGPLGRSSTAEAEVALDLFGRREVDELVEFSSYMRHRHLKAKRQAVQMREATERSRDRVAFEAAAAAVMAVAREFDNEQDKWLLRRYYTSTSFDLAAKGLWGQGKGKRRGASESQLLAFDSPAYPSRAAAAAAAAAHPTASTSAAPRQSGPTKSFVSFLRRRAAKERQQKLPHSPLQFSRPRRLNDPAVQQALPGQRGSGQQHLSPLGGPFGGSHGGLPSSLRAFPGSPAASAASPGRLLAPVGGAPSPGRTAAALLAPPACLSPNSGGLWSKLSNVKNKIKPKGAAAAAAATQTSSSSGNNAGNASVINWLKQAARSNSDIWGAPPTGKSPQGGPSWGPLGGRAGVSAGRFSFAAGESPMFSQQPAPRKSFLSRILPGMGLCRRGKREEQELKRIDFLRNAMRAGDDPFETNKLAAAAASAAVRDIRRRSSSSTLSEDLIESAKGAATAAAAAAAADFPPLRGGSLHALPEDDANEGLLPESQWSLEQRMQQQQQQQQQQEAQQSQSAAQSSSVPNAALQGTDAAATGAATAEGAPFLRYRSATMPDPQYKSPVLLLPPLPPNSVDYYEQQQQQQQQQQQETAESSPSRSPVQESKSWEEQIEKADGTTVYFLEDVTDFSRLLNPSGQAAARRLLWALFAFFRGGLEFCPANSQGLKSVTVLRSVGACAVSVELVTAVVEAIRLKFPRLFLHMRHLGVDVPAWAARGLQDAFARLLPFDFVLRIMSAFLFEGSLALCKFSLALVQLLEPELMACDTTEAAERVLYRCSTDPRLSINELSSTAQNLKPHIWRVVGDGTTGLQSPYLMSTKIHEFLTIRPEGISRIITSLDTWETLWRWLPDILRYSTPFLIFSSSHDGFTLSALLNRALYYSAPFIFLATSDNHDVFGFFSPVPFENHKTSACFSYSEAFVFTLSPLPRAFWWTGANSAFLRVRSEGLFLGSDGVALWVDPDLSRCRSSASASFGSQSLVTSEFGDCSLLQIEIWGLR